MSFKKTCQITIPSNNIPFIRPSVEHNADAHHNVRHGDSSRNSRMSKTSVESRPVAETVTIIGESNPRKSSCFQTPHRLRHSVHVGVLLKGSIGGETLNACHSLIVRTGPRGLLVIVCQAARILLE